MNPRYDRTRYTSFTQAQNDVLIAIANNEGSRVAILLRRAAIIVFDLPTDGSDDADDGDESLPVESLRKISSKSSG